MESSEQEIDLAIPVTTQFSNDLLIFACDSNIPIPWSKLNHRTKRVLLYFSLRVCLATGEHFQFGVIGLGTVTTIRLDPV
jgi:hypothetical protein